MLSQAYGHTIEMKLHVKVLDHAARNVKTMAKEDINARPHALALWGKENVLTQADEGEPLHGVSVWYKRSPCFMVGKTICICSGEGLVAKWATRILASSLCLVRPAKSNHRT